MKKRSDVLILTFTTFAFLASANARAQSADVIAQADQAQSAQAPDQGTTDKPVAAAGEEGKKPTGDESAKPARGFLSALTHNLGDDVKHMPRMNTVYWLAGGGALALAVHPEDKKINARLVSSGSADKVFVAGHIIGNTAVLLGASASIYVYGRAKHHQRAQHLGMDLLESTILSEGIVEGLKLAVRRDRPVEVGGGTQSKTYSFPSGHAAVTFAAATVLQQHLGYKAAIPTYLIATYVAMSRLHDNRHYASDVVFGAATGIVVGRSVTWHGRNFYASPMLVPGGGGIMLMAVR